MPQVYAAQVYKVRQYRAEYAAPVPELKGD